MREWSESVAAGTSVPSAGTRFAREPRGSLAAELDAAREPVLAYVRSAFPRARDLEDVYQEACVEVLEMASRGERVRDVQALLKTIAWRHARANRRRKRADSLDAQPGGANVVADDALAPDEEAQLRIDGDALRLIVESLDQRQAAVIKLRFECGLTGPEIQRELGITAKRLEKTISAAYDRIAEELAPDGTAGEIHWRRRQRSLFLACLVGIATRRQRRWAEDMLQRDPSSRAMFAEIRAAFEDVAAVLPLPILAERSERRAGILGRLDELWLSIRHIGETVTGRAASSGATEQAGAGGAMLGAGAAAKIAVACLAVGGAATVCLGVGDPPKARPRVQVEAIRPKPTQRKQITARPRVTPTPRATSKAKQATTGSTTHASTTSQPRVPVSSPASTAAASPAPAGSSEFGPGSVGSTPPSQQPAAAPQDGGGEFTP